MKRHLLLIALLALMLCSFTLLQAQLQTVTIGNGTESQYFPFNAYYGYGRSLGLYTQEQIQLFGKITRLGWQVATSSSVTVPYKIYIKTTTERDLTKMTWAQFTGGATLTAQGSYTFSSQGWHELLLTTPFVYTGGNLLIGVEANYGGSGGGDYCPKFYYSTGDVESHQTWQQDGSAPTTQGYVRRWLPNVRLKIAPAENNPILSVYPMAHNFGNTVVNCTYRKTITIGNSGNGNLTVSSLTPSSSGCFSVETGFVFPFVLPAGNTVSFTIKYTPTSAGNHSASFTVTSSLGGEVPKTVTVSGSAQDVTISALPWTEDFSSPTFPPSNWGQYKGWYPTQSLIPTTKGWVKRNFANISDPANPAARVDISDISTRYWLVSPPISIPASGDYQLDFDLALTMMGGSNPVTPGNQPSYRFLLLTSDQPYMENATVLREWNNTGSPHVFDNIATYGEHLIFSLDGYTGTRFFAFYGESTDFGGGVGVHVDNVCVREVPASITPEALDFGSVLINSTSQAMNVTVTNLSSSVLNLSASDISIIGPNAADFAFSEANLPASLTTGQSVVIPVTVTGSSEGDISATLRIVCQGLGYDVALTAHVSGQSTVSIGNGTLYNSGVHYPAVYGGYYKNAREQYIVTAAELTAAGAQAGLFNSIGFNVVSPNNCGNLPNFTISLGTTAAEEFVDENFLTGLTEMYSVAGYTPVAGWNVHPFTTPFYWDGSSNLVIQTSFDMQDGYSQNASTYHSETDPAFRTLYYRSDGTAWNTVASGIRSLDRPNMNFMFRLPIAGPPAVPILSSPADGATGLSKHGFELKWAADYDNGGIPDHYQLYLSTDPANMEGGYSWTTTSNCFNPVAADPTFSFAYSQQYYWTVKAVNSYSSSTTAAPRSFVIESDPTIYSYPWIENFDSVSAGSMPHRWTVIASQNYGNSIPGWTATPNVGCYSEPHAAVAYAAWPAPKNEWMMTVPFSMQAGQTYNISFMVIAPRRGPVAEDFAVYHGAEPTVDAMTANPALFTNDQTSYDDWTRVTFSFTPPSTGSYYFGWHAYSPTDLNQIVIDDISISEIKAADLAVVSLDSGLFNKVGTAFNHTVKVENVGTNPQSGYTVYLKKQGTGAVLAQKQISATLAANETAEHTLSWTPTTTGFVNVYAEVVRAGDQNSSNNTSAAKAAYIIAANAQTLYVGNPETPYMANFIPFDSNEASFVNETVYLASEVQATGGTIQAISYSSMYTEGADTLPVQIWMKNTTATDLNDGWLPSGDYQLVFQGDVICPAGYHEITIPLDTHFNYMGGNVAVRIGKSSGAVGPFGCWWRVTGDFYYPDRVRASTGAVDPANPSGGSLWDYVPNITFIMTNANLVETLAAPVVNVTVSEAGVGLNWELIPYAHSYNIYTSEEPYNFGDEPLGTVYTNDVSISSTTAKLFFKVTAKTYRDSGRAQAGVLYPEPKHFNSIDGNLIGGSRKITH